jgi:hypothetical protein
MSRPTPKKQGTKKDDFPREGQLESNWHKAKGKIEEMSDFEKEQMVLKTCYRICIELNHQRIYASCYFFMVSEGYGPQGQVKKAFTEYIPEGKEGVRCELVADMFLKKCKEIFGEKIPLEMFAGGEGIKLQATISSASSKSISQKQAKSELSDSLSLAELDMASSCSGSGYFSDFNSQSSQSSAQVSPTCNHPDFREFMAQTALSSINPNHQGRELAPLARSLREEPLQQWSQPSKLAKTSRKTSFGTRASSDESNWWESVDPEQRSDIQRFIAEASRVYSDQPDQSELVKRDCMAKFQLSNSQYQWTLTHLLRGIGEQPIPRNYSQRAELAPLARSPRKGSPQQWSPPSKLAKTSRITTFGTRASSDESNWWESVDPEQRSDIQRFIAEASRVYSDQPELVKRDCITKFQLSNSQYQWTLTHLLRGIGE